MDTIIGLVFGFITGAIITDWIQLRLDTMFSKRVIAKTERKIETLRLYKLRYESLRDIKKSTKR